MTEPELKAVTDDQLFNESFAKCGNCIWNTVGHCKRFPPHYVYHNMDKHFGNSFSFFPSIKDGDCCGEFKDKQGRQVTMSFAAEEGG